MSLHAPRCERTPACKAGVPLILREGYWACRTCKYTRHLELTLPVLREVIRTQEVRAFDLRAYNRKDVRYPEVRWAFTKLCDAVKALTGNDVHEEVDKAVEHVERSTGEDFWYGLSWATDTLTEALRKGIHEPEQHDHHH